MGVLRKIQSGFDEIEESFSINRMNLLIGRRDVEKKIRKMTRSIIKKNQENKEQSETADNN